jgi:hypothetical protein
MLQTEELRQAHLTQHMPTSDPNAMVIFITVPHLTIDISSEGLLINFSTLRIEGAGSS